MVYKWKTGSHHKVPAAVAAEVIEKLTEEERLTAADLVDESRPEDAPLHEEFEWDDSVAAEKYREDQARAIIRHVTVCFEKDGQEYQTRQYFMVQKETQVYEPIQIILKNEDKRAMLLDQAKRELRAFKAKYATLTELTQVFDAIDSVA